MNNTRIDRIYIPLLLAILFIWFSTPLMGRKMGYTVDATPSFQITQQIVQNGDLFPPAKVKQGYIYSIAYIPFYEFGTLLHSLFPSNSAEWWQRKCMCWMNTIWTALTIGLLSLVLLELNFSRRVRTAMPLLYGFSTMAFAYARYDYNKCLAAFLLLAAFYFLLRYLSHNKAQSVLFSSISLALLVMVRLEFSLLIVFFLIVLIWHFRTWKRMEYIQFLLPIGAGLLFVIWYNWAYWGGELTGGYQEDSKEELFTFFHGLLGFLASPGKNIWVFNPILLFLPLACRPFYHQNPRLFWIWMGTLCIPFLFYSAWGNWWGGWGWGPRHLVPLLPLAVIPLAIFFENRASPFLSACWIAGALGFLIQLLGASLDFNDVILTLEKAGIEEQTRIWNPLCNAVYQHVQFLLHLPIPRWDFGIISIYTYVSFPLFVLIITIWMIGLGILLTFLVRLCRVKSLENGKGTHAQENPLNHRPR